MIKTLSDIVLGPCNHIHEKTMTWKQEWQIRNQICSSISWSRISRRTSTILHESTINDNKLLIFPVKKGSSRVSIIHDTRRKRESVMWQSFRDIFREYFFFFLSETLIYSRSTKKHNTSHAKRTRYTVCDANFWSTGLFGLISLPGLCWRLLTIVF